LPFIAAPASLILRAAGGAGAFERISIERPVVGSGGARRVVGVRACVITLNDRRVIISGTDRTRWKASTARLPGLIIGPPAEPARAGALRLRVVKIKHRGSLRLYD
jgi:hypothetical protein